MQLLLHLSPAKFECPFCCWDSGETNSQGTLQRLQVTAL